MKKIEEIELKEKLNSLFEESDKTFKDPSYTDTERSEILDLTEEEILEVAEYVKRHEESKPPKKRPKFTFSFFGKILFNLLLVLAEILIVTFLLWVLIPFGINKEVTIINCWSITLIIAILKKWIQK